MRSRFYERDGKTQTLGEWCRELGLPYLRVYMRIERGMTFEEAISKPPGSLAKPKKHADRERLVTIDGKTQSLHAWCVEKGISYNAVIKRVLKGAEPLEAMKLATNPLRTTRTLDLRGTWRNMIARCTDETRRDYKNYGGRGIRVCKRWQDYEAFCADMAPRPEGHSLDRIDNDGDYSPENCRWSLPGAQARNRRANHFVTIDGETKCFVDWCTEAGTSAVTGYRLIARGMTPEQSVAELRKRSLARM